MHAFLKLIKFKNLLIIAIAQLSVRYGLFEPFDVDITLNGFGIALLIIATLCITAAGNIIIEIYDTEEGVENRVLPSGISEKRANQLFILFNVIGVLIGFYLSNLINKPGFVALFIITSGMFYIYTTYLKEILILKNIIIGLLAALPVIAIGIFDLLPSITMQNKVSQTVVFSIILDYAFFASILVVIREIIKDCIHIDQDHNHKLKTVPIAFGKDRTVKIVGILTLIPLLSVIYYIYNYFFSNFYAVCCILLFIVAPLLYITIKSWTAETQKNLIILSNLLKGVLVITALYLYCYQFIILK